MKAILLSALFAVSAMATTASAATTEETLAQAQQAYSERDYNAAGIQRSQDAADLYGQLVAQAADVKAKAKFLAAQSEALYFVGNASEDNAVKIAKHLKGMELANEAVKIMGVTDVSHTDAAALKASLSAEDMNLLAEGLYQRGVNLGQWGSANGVMESLSKWPELRDNMQLIIDLGKKDIHEYGPFRTLGRGYFKIPALLGGSTKKADKYLSTAVNSTLAAGEIYSINAYNNVYYAETLHENGDTQKATELLQAFLKADANTLNKTSIPETKKAQQEATELLKNW